MSHELQPRPQERRVISLEDYGISDVALGRYAYHSVKPGLSSHRHLRAVEICYLARGCQTYRLQGREYHLVGGDLFVVPPGEPHDTGGQPEDCGVLYWLILRIPNHRASLLTLGAKDTSVISKRLLSLPRLHFPGRPVLKHIFDRLFDLYDAPTDDLKTLALKHHLLSCILEVLDCAYNDQRRQHSKDINRAIQHIISHSEEELSLSSLAEEARLSLSRFKVKFKSETGIAPREFVLRAKVEDAKKSLVGKQLSVTDIAMNLGFSSSQYFATVFKRFTQQTPIQFRGVSSCPANTLSRGTK
jgi:AraC-like DNA-binding protein